MRSRPSSASAGTVPAVPARGCSSPTLDLGCRAAQGYLPARPAPAAQFSGLVSRALPVTSRQPCPLESPLKAASDRLTVV